MAMSDQARAAYEDALKRATLKHGTLVDRRPDVYGWMDLEWEHTRRCRVTATGPAYEDTWSEFVSSFDGDATKHGVRVDGVSCECGELKERSIRWCSTVQNIAEAVFEEAFGADEERGR